jgi:hypothetical protein
MVASREASLVWVLVVSVACGGRSRRHDDDAGVVISTEGGAPGSAPLGAAGTIGVGGTLPVVESAGAAGLGGTAGIVETNDVAGAPARDPDPPSSEGPCDPHDDPLDPTSPEHCAPPAPAEDDCDDLARRYEREVGIAQWCTTDAQCHSGVPVRATLDCGCDVIVRTVAKLAPIAAQWRSQGCTSDLPCPRTCVPPGLPYVCGEAGFCLDDR